MNTNDTVISPCDVQMLKNEYESLATEAKKSPLHDQAVNWDVLCQALHEQAGWTEYGATHIVGLVRKYGIFVLRNALALSIAVGVDDGEMNM